MSQKTTSIARAIAVTVAAFASFGAFAVDSFDPATNLLTMEAVTTGGATYRNVAVTVSSFDLIGVGGGAPAADTFNPANSVLLLGTVAFQGATYNNVSIKINAYTILNVGGTGTPGTLGGTTYTGEMAGYLAALNNYRTQCGIPAMAQNTLLDSAAQTVGTGVGSQLALAAAAGYAVPNTTGGIRSDYWSNSTNVALVGQYELQTALMDPGALISLMRQYTEIGMVGTLTKAGSTNQRGARVMFGNPVSRNITTPVTFPCANTTDVAPYWPGSGGYIGYAGMPVTALSSDYFLGSNGTQGTPIAVYANPGDTLVLTAATVTAHGGAGVPVTMQFGGRTMYGYEGYVWPQQTLFPNTAYDVVIVGTVNGTGFSKNFTFKTGAAIPLALQ